MLYFLKLGGSLITDKSQPHTARIDTLKRAAQEIADALRMRQDLRLVIGHGSGSFGHMPAERHGTRMGVSSAVGWWGFIEVFREARSLNQLVLESLLDAGLPVIAFPPSAAIIAANGEVQSWDLRPLQAALVTGLIPLVYGDVIFDAVRGGTILSTEELFSHLAKNFKPQRILLAGIEAGVWQDYPARKQIVETITPSSFDLQSSALSGAAAVDVTGGMRQKVEIMLGLVRQMPELEGLIFSGEEPGLIYQALLGDLPGTTIHK